MVDIHSHILPFLDDGSASFEKSLEMLKKEAELGVTDVILTPHYRFDYRNSRGQVEKIFAQLNEQAKKASININLHLGLELLIDRDYKKFIASDELITLNGSKYLLIEFDLGAKQNILDPVYEIKRLGFIPVVAHFERYFYADLNLAFQVKELGGLIQVNAGSIVKSSMKSAKKLAKQLFKNGLVDFVASDVHDFRENLLDESYQHITKKFGKQTADKVFIENAQLILKG